MRKKYWHHIPCPTILILLSSVGIATAQSYPEIVIPVSDAEARRVTELDRGWEMRYEIASWQSKGRIRIAKINGETLALAGELVQFTPFDDADPIVIMSDGLEPTEHAALFTWSASSLDPVTRELAMNGAVRNAHNVSLYVASVPQNPDTGDILMRPEWAQEYAINPANGNLQRLEWIESSTRSLAIKEGFNLCEKGSSHAKEEVEWFLGADNTVIPADGAALCEPMGDVFEFMKRLSAESRAMSPYNDYRRARPWPDNVVMTWQVSGHIFTDGLGRIAEAKSLNGHHYRIMHIQNNSTPEYVLIFEPVRHGPNMMIDDMRSVAQREADYNSPRMVAHRKTEAYRLQKENDESYRDHLLAWETRYQARVKASAGGQ